MQRHTKGCHRRAGVSNHLSDAMTELTMPFDIQRIRAETPGLQHVNHLFASGAGLMPQPVIDAVTNHIELEARIGGYEAAA
ncbi:MAG: hypothetical protein ACR2O4_00795, partial [Hyphomicrobiaceae bacterium]